MSGTKYYKPGSQESGLPGSTCSLLVLPFPFSAGLSVSFCKMGQSNSLTSKIPPASDCMCLCNALISPLFPLQCFPSLRGRKNAGKCVRRGSPVGCRGTGTELLRALMGLAHRVPGTGAKGLDAKCGDSLSVSLQWALDSWTPLALLLGSERACRA